MATQKWTIKDWMGNTCFKGKTFPNFESAWDYIYVTDPEPDRNSPDWQSGWFDDYYVVRFPNTPADLP